MKNVRKILAIILAITAICSVGLAGCDSSDNEGKGNIVSDDSVNTINLNNYVYFNTEGATGSAYVSAHVNGYLLTYMCSHYARGIYTADDIERTINGYDNNDIVPFQLVADKSSDISNGDVIDFSWVINEYGLKMMEQKVNAKFVYSDFSYTVTDALEITVINPFEDDRTEIFGSGSFANGTSEDIGEIDIVFNGRGTSLEIDTMGHTGVWKNGDQVKVTIPNFSSFSDEELLKDAGVVFSERTAVITVNWLE